MFKISRYTTLPYHRRHYSRYDTRSAHSFHFAATFIPLSSYLSHQNRGILLRQHQPAPSLSASSLSTPLSKSSSYKVKSSINALLSSIYHSSSLSISNISSSLPSSIQSSFLSSILPQIKSVENTQQQQQQQPPQQQQQSSSSDYDDIVVEVRHEDGIGPEEQHFIQQRRRFVHDNMISFIHQHHHHHPFLSPSSSSSLNLSPTSHPNIGICLSGGGYRAMLGSLSSLNALQQIGVLDCTDYISGLSGSTWAMTQLYSHPSHRKKHHHMTSMTPSTSKSSLSMQSILDTARIHVSQPLLSRSLSSSYDPLISIMKRTIAEKWSSSSLTFNDFYGWFLTQRILMALIDPDDPTYISSLSLSSQQDALLDSLLPFPLYTAINTPDHIQFEFSPYEMGSHELAAFIPTFGLGRTYQHGRSTSNYPREPHLSTMLTLFSSAHCTDLLHQIEEILYQMKGHEKLKHLILSYLQKMKHYKKIYPFTPMTFPNYMYQIQRSIPSSASYPQHNGHYNPFQQHNHHQHQHQLHDGIPVHLTSSPQLSLMDAGLSFNYPLIPLLQWSRQLDLIILCDFTSPPEALTGIYFHTVQRYCHVHGLPLPSYSQGYQPLGIIPVKPDEHLPTQDIEKVKSNEREVIHAACHSRVTVFPGDVSSHIPTIIYIPLLSNPAFNPDFCPRTVFLAGGFTSTLNFVYTHDESGLLCGLVETNVKECEGVIRDCIEKIWKEKDQLASLHS